MRYIGPKVKILRRLNLSKIPALTSKTNNKFKFRKKQSLFSTRLIEKQKLCYNFGINNHQFFRYIQKANKLSGSTGEILLKLLELRFDNILYRLKLAPTIHSAKQLIIHGHFLINNKKITIPSYQCKSKDIISVRPKSKKLINTILDAQKSFLINENVNTKNDTSSENNKQFTENKDKNTILSKNIPQYLVLNENDLTGKIVSNNISLNDKILKKYYDQLELRILYVLEFFSQQL